MAIDTAQKRQSVPGVGRPWMRTQFPVTTPTQAWRLNVGNVYSGNALDVPVAGQPYWLDNYTMPDFLGNQQA